MDSVAERTRRRVTWRLIPFLFFLYILAYLDRVNIGVADLHLRRPLEEGGLALPADVIGRGKGIFFWGYWILEIPSTLLVLRWGARWIFARILILWGFCATVVGFIGLPGMTQALGWLPRLPENSWLPEWLVHFVNHLPTDPAYQLYFFRFMLGVFEGGFFPSVIVYISLWFRQEDRARAFAGFTMAIPMANLLGNAGSGFLLDVSWLGLQGWRWIFILEGIAPMLAGVVTFFVMPETPDKARWLPEDERAWLLGELEREKASQLKVGHWDWLSQSGLVLLLTVVYFCRNVTNYGLNMSMPAIMKSLGPLADLPDWLISLIASLPFVMATLGIWLNGWNSDRTKERILHSSLPLFLLALGIFITATLEGAGIWPVFLMIFLVGTFMNATLPAFWPLPRKLLGATAAASAVGFINMIGNIGGSVGPELVGKQVKAGDSYAGSLLWLIPWPIAAGVIVLAIGYWKRSALK